MWYAFQEMKKKKWLRSLLGVLFCFFFGWGRGFYWLGFLLNDGDTWAVHLMLDGGCEKDWCGYWSILCFLSFNLKKDTFWQTISSFHLSKNKNKKVRERFIWDTSNEDGDSCGLWDEFKHLEWILKLQPHHLATLVRWGSAIWTKINWKINDYFKWGNLVFG